ncbi:trypsin-like peptidase domain-containing protein [Anabaena variabilis FACHB-164]|nr:trypsin-like peptidase domain-containing protein [Trichormus variabilis FACHB-164]
MVASPAFAKQALIPTEVAKIAKSTLVLIKPTVNSPGSGVIIGRYKEGRQSVYVVLTANHVVQYDDDEYQVITPIPQEGRKQRQKIEISTTKDIQRLPGVDLAIVRFRSNRNFTVATLGDSNHTTEGAGIYVAGFPNKGLAIKVRAFQFTSSQVSSRLDIEDSIEGENETGVENGYALTYTAVTRAGMSGGPVFDVSGRVVGIHGRGDQDESSKQSAVIKTGFNLGIPIQTFLKLVPNAVQQFGITLDTSEPGLFNNLIATRGGSNRVPPTINITEEDVIEEEGAESEVESKQSDNNTPSRPKLPSQPVIQPSVTNQNTTPTPTPTPTQNHSW